MSPLLWAIIYPTVTSQHDSLLFPIKMLTCEVLKAILTGFDMNFFLVIFIIKCFTYFLSGWYSATFPGNAQTAKSHGFSHFIISWAFQTGRIDFPAGSCIYTGFYAALNSIASHHHKRLFAVELFSFIFTYTFAQSVYSFKFIINLARKVWGLQQAKVWTVCKCMAETSKGLLVFDFLCKMIYPLPTTLLHFNPIFIDIFNTVWLLTNLLSEIRVDVACP